MTTTIADTGRRLDTIASGTRGLLYGLALALYTLHPALAQEQSFSSQDRDNLLFDPVPLDDGSPITRPEGPPAPPSREERDAAGAQALAIADNIDAYEKSIESTLAADGPFSNRLKEEYQSLGQLQEQFGEYEKAIASFEQAMHIARVNDGLFTLGQIDYVQHILDNLAQLQDVDRETDYRGYLYYLQQKAYPAGDPRLLKAKIDWADWNMNAFARGLSGSPYAVKSADAFSSNYIAIQDSFSGQVIFVPRRSVETISDTDPFSANLKYSVNPDFLIDKRLKTAEDIYDSLLEDGEFDLTESQQQALQLKRISAEFTKKRLLNNMIGDQSLSVMNSRLLSPRPQVQSINQGYRESLAALTAMIDKLNADPMHDPLELANAYLQLGDLQIAYDNPVRSRGEYEKSWQVLLDAGMEDAAISKVINPSRLVAVPAFALQPYTRATAGLKPDEAVNYRGHIDTSMTVDKNGNLRRIAVLDASEGTPYQVRKLLLEYLHALKVRPILAQGKVAASAPFSLRFYYWY